MNIINAIYNLVNRPVIDVVSYYTGKNRANNSGDALEEYIKDLFAGTFDMNETERLETLNNVFSYLGNNSNPPDAMLRGGDAIETKKIESNGSALALNSSYPKHDLKSDSPMISNACRTAEHWIKKDMIYAVGIVNNDKLKHLAMVYGLDYCASEECYSRIKTTIKNGVESIPGVEFAESRELGHINKVDPLGITYMRVRGMWGIENPWKVFEYIYQRDFTNSFNFMCIINESKWNSFDNTELITSLHIHGFDIRDVRIKNPDNPAQLVNAKLITYFLN
ncbi:MAG: NgoPII family restriction endonuclease [Clostridia bacterium]|nr:NgoPII family restriction endonuclease [Clostridia bacterium]